MHANFLNILLSRHPRLDRRIGRGVPNDYDREAIQRWSTAGPDKWIARFSSLIMLHYNREVQGIASIS